MKAVEEELQTYTDLELRIWNKGYLAAIEGLLEQIQDDEIRILNHLLVVEGTEKRRTQLVLEARLKVLEAYEDHYKTRLQQLKRDAE